MGYPQRLMLSDELQLSDAEWRAACCAGRSDLLAFYVELRRALPEEYHTGAPFKLSPSHLATNRFLPGRQDRKFYTALRDDLTRVGLIQRVKGPHYDLEGRRVPALYCFSNPRASNVIFLAARSRS
jgi:hypothetical protein